MAMTIKQKSGNTNKFNELNNEQRRQTVDSRQVFEAYRASSEIWAHSFAGSMRWGKRKGREYLLRKEGKAETSLGVRSAETEAKYNGFTEGRERLKGELEGLSARLNEMAPVNRALRLGRVPALSARIIRRVDEASLLGTHILIVGTNALYAYEAAAGVVLESGLLATGDADLLWDARRSLRILLPDVRREGILGLLQRVDTSFKTRRRGDYRAFNREGFYVDLIRPEDEDLITGKSADRIGEDEDDLTGSPIHGLHWLINAPRYEAIAMGEDGYPLRLIAPDPRAFALHKLWVSSLRDRDPLKRQRDHDQAFAVARIAREYLGLDFNSEDLSALPKELRDLAKLLPSGPKPKAKKPAADRMPGPAW